jgi:hypothetical protein
MYPIPEGVNPIVKSMHPIPQSVYLIPRSIHPIVDIKHTTTGPYAGFLKGGLHVTTSFHTSVYKNILH